MKTLNISISENEFNQYGFTHNKMTFGDLLKIVNHNSAQQKAEGLDNSLSLDEFVIKTKQILRKKFDERDKDS